MYNKCPECDCLISSNPEIKPFHNLLCSFNTLSVPEWERENKERNERLLTILTNMIESEEETKKLSYKELAQFLMESDFYGKMLIGSKEESKLARIIDILLKLDAKEKENVS